MLKVWGKEKEPAKNYEKERSRRSPPLSTRNPTKWEVGDIQEPTGQRGTHGASAPSVQALALISLRTRKQSVFHDLSRTTTLALLTLADT